MKKGDIVFVQGNSIISRIIRILDKGDFSHVAIAVSDYEIIEAEYKSKVSIVNVENYKGLKYKTISIGSESDREALVEESKRFIGMRYDYKQILSYVLFKLFGYGMKNSSDRFICSELVVSAMYNSGVISRNTYKKLVNCTPNELYKFLTAIKKGRVNNGRNS